MYLPAMITLLLTNALISHGQRYSKCCKFGEQLAGADSSYECVKNEEKQLEVFSNRTNFLDSGVDGECAEISSGFFVFDVSNGTITGRRQINEYFPKCCPLNNVYNSILHSCERRDDLNHAYIHENFVKVGLPNCKVVVDYELNGTADFEYDLSDMRKSKGKKNSLKNPGTFCIDENERGSFVMRECKSNFGICEEMRCIKKCCPDGQSFINGAVCYDTYTHGLNFSGFSSIKKPEEPYAIIHNRSCPNIYMMKESKYTFTLDEKGTFNLWQNSTQRLIQENVYNTRSYCIEHTKKKNIEGHFFFMCFSEKKINEKFAYTALPKMLSCVCLVMTVAVYLVLNETRNVFGKILVNYCVALFFGDAILTYAQLNLRPTDIECKFRSFLIIFFATASFSWSNVMCCDIWWTFGSARRTLGAHQRKRDLRKLLSYFLYGWGVPTIQTVVILFFYSYRILPYSVQPFLAIKKCFFERLSGNYAHALFFNLPHLVIQLVNTVLFVKTIVYCLKVKNEINKINDTTKDDKNKRFQKDKERLFLIVKLSVIMGVSFIFEVVSAFFDMSQMGTIPKYIEIVWDAINCSQGIFIFIIFICKKKIYRDFLLKFKLLRPRSISTSSIHTQSTITSNGTNLKVLKPIGEFGKIT